MLIELKAECQHGEFLPNLARVLGIEKKESANAAASKLMTLARNLPLLQERKPGRLHTSGVMLSATHHYGAL